MVAFAATVKLPPTYAFLAILKLPLPLTSPLTYNLPPMVASATTSTVLALTSPKVCSPASTISCKCFNDVSIFLVIPDK